MNRQRAVIALIIGALYAVGGITGCSRTDHVYFEKESPMENKTIEQVQEEYTGQWLAIPGIEGTAIGLFEGKPCIKIFSSIKAEQLRSKIPMTIEGYPVIIEETGIFRAFDRQ